MQHPDYSEWKDTTRKLCNFAINGIGVLVVAIAIFAKQDKSLVILWSPDLAPIAEWLLKHYTTLILVLVVIGAVLKFVSMRLERTWVWSAVQAIVNRIQEDAFGEQEGYAHHHRATLFRYKRYLWWPFPMRHRFWPWGWARWPGSGWMVPELRSGYTTQKTRTYFLAPDDADHAEGVAGHVWAMNKEIALSAGHTLQPGSNANDIAQYASSTFVSATWAAAELSKDKTLAASFRGVPIEGKGGRNWGVLMLDSRDADAAMNAQLKIEPYAYCLGKLLERV